MKTVTAVVIGYGSRGSIYSMGQEWYKGREKIIAVADLNNERLDQAKEYLGLPDEMCFKSADELLAQPRLADVAFICTQDQQHHEHAIAALRKGYHLLLEKPIAVTYEQCRDIYELARELNRTVLVCHVLRYTPFYSEIKRIIDSGRLGEIVCVDQIENVGFWHMGHSYVRGNWKNLKIASPMILAKSCHDLDILYWLIGKKPERLSSYGSLKHFKPENAPEGSAERCLDCEVRKECPYDAQWLYLDGKFLSIKGVGNKIWPVNCLVDNPTPEKVEEALRTGPYGVCIYQSDNDVVDHQVVNMEFEGGATAAFTMSGFSNDMTREIKIMGTLGELSGSMEDDIIYVQEYRKKREKIELDYEYVGGAHNGGDYHMLNDILNYFGSFPIDENGFMGVDNQTLPKGSPIALISDTMISHKACFAAEKSRLESGKSIDL